jgi:superfamily II DNA or RNA helicase
MKIALDQTSVDDYGRFLRIKSLPKYRVTGGAFAEFPDEYASLVGVDDEQAGPIIEYAPWPGQWDYQEAISALSIAKRKFAVFADCGLGKTFIMGEFARHARAQLPATKRVLITSPLMVIGQTVEELAKFYGGTMEIERVPASKLAAWCQGSGGIGITNYDAMHEDIPQGNLGALLLDESSMLKSHYGKWGTTCIRLGRGLEWKLALTGTPAPNDRIEYANHAVFLDAFPTVNAFLARFFVNRGQTDNRWELKPHALRPFYQALSHWCIFLNNPATYGWKDNCAAVPPVIPHIERVELTREQTELIYEKEGTLFPVNPGGITSRARLASIAKGWNGDEAVASNKPDHIRKIVEAHPTESIIIWCLYNREQDSLAALMPYAASIDGSTPDDERERIVSDFRHGKVRVLISKPKILGFGLNLQIATRHIFSGLQDSYESYYQAVKRSNRYGSTSPLHVHIPITDIERPMVDTVLAKADRVRHDTEEQERIFKESSLCY